MKRYHLHPMGSTCYDNTGITFPNSKLIDFKALLKSCGAKNVRWARLNGWSNLPLHICFNADETTLININRSLRAEQILEIYPREKDW